MKYEIKHRFKGSVLFSLDCGSMKLCLEAAIKVGANLSGADLRGADLLGADLRGADLRGADLSSANLLGANLLGANLLGANLSSANLLGANLLGANLLGADLRGTRLRGADLRGARLSNADLSHADLLGANLSSANLLGANLLGANLLGANLSSADLSSADLSSANMTPIRDDFWAVLSAAPCEADGLRQALIHGRVDGSTYEGKCACLVGTIANIRGENYQELGVVKPNSNRPIERFFLNISKGDTPETNQCSALAVQWTDEFLFNMREAFGASHE